MMKNYLGAPIFLAAGVLLGVISALVGAESFGTDVVRADSPWQRRDTSTTSSAYPYAIAHYLLDGRLPPAEGQFVELFAIADADGSRFRPECDTNLTLPDGRRPRWWSVAAFAAGDANLSAQAVMSGETAIAEANGDIRITVSGRPRPGNWIKAPNARSYVLIYTVAAEGGMVTGSPRDVPLFSIKQGGC